MIPIDILVYVSRSNAKVKGHTVTPHLVQRITTEHSTYEVSNVIDRYS